MAAQLFRQVTRYWSAERLQTHALAVVVGIFAALGTIAIREAIDWLNVAAFGLALEREASRVNGLAWWHIVIVPTLGGLGVGLAAKYLLPGGRPQGPADVIEAALRHGGRMRLRDGLAAAFVSAGSLGVGASVGREGPAVHLGAALASWMGRMARLSPTSIRVLLGGGAAAAVAASFNAPLAGVFFAVEVIIGGFALHALGPILVASIVGTTVSRAYYGEFPAFVLPEAFVVHSFWELPLFLLLGIFCGLAALALMASIMAVDDLHARLKTPPLARPVIAGFCVGLIALAYPQVMGAGYEATDLAIHELLPLSLMVILVVVKIAATAICLGSGFGGGVFTPALFVGAMLGGAFGVLAIGALPDAWIDQFGLSHGAYTLVGMGAVAGVVLGSPVSTILIIFEMTANYELTLAVMIAVVTATMVSDLLVGQSFFAWQLRRRGLFLRTSQATRVQPPRNG